MNRQFPTRTKHSRRAVTIVAAVTLLVALSGGVAFVVGLGYVVWVRTQLQATADSAAICAAGNVGRTFHEVVQAAEKYAARRAAKGSAAALEASDVELGLWNPRARTFTPLGMAGNAVRVTTHRDSSTDRKTPRLVMRIFNPEMFDMSASAVAVANPRDIVFVVDLSGSMNDDTEPCWATEAIDGDFAPQRRPAVGTELMQQVFDDFGFGAYPGQTQSIGRPWGISDDKYAYAELTKHGGPMTGEDVPDRYRIRPSDGEQTRKRKCYSALIDFQIAAIMPAARPAPDSSTNYDYWEKYLDYIISPCEIPALKPDDAKGGSPSAISPGRGLRPAETALSEGTPGTGRGRLPPRQDHDRISGFNNPNLIADPKTSRDAPLGFYNRIGYLTYVQFMMDFGRDLKPDGRQFVPLSRHSPDCPWHPEATAAGTFDFPPRTQPMHAVRRALIAALESIKQRNAGAVDPSQADWVAIVSFDTLSGGGPVIEQPLTADYDAAIFACARLQAVGDKGPTTATEAGLLAAKGLFPSDLERGRVRRVANKVVVLVTDGVPDLYVSDASEIDDFIRANPNSNFYGDGTYCCDAPLVQVRQMQREGWQVFPVGVGRGVDHDFTDRLARLGGTADQRGQSPRGRGNPAEYEQWLNEIFGEIITNPRVKIVQ